MTPSNQTVFLKTSIFAGMRGPLKKIKRESGTWLVLSKQRLWNLFVKKLSVYFAFNHKNIFVVSFSGWEVPWETGLNCLIFLRKRKGIIFVQFFLCFRTKKYQIALSSAISESLENAFVTFAKLISSGPASLSSERSMLSETRTQNNLGLTIVYYIDTKHS